MNKIYKVIWSKVKNCYIVVSELAKRVSRSSSPARAGRAGLAAIMAATALTVGTIGMDTVQAATTTTVYGASTNSHYAVLGAEPTGTVVNEKGQTVNISTYYELRHIPVTDNAGNPVYRNGLAVTKSLYVLKGYDAIIRNQQQIMDTDTPTYKDLIVEVVVADETKIPSAIKDHTLISAQSIVSPITDSADKKVTTVLGTALNSIGMSTYIAAADGGTLADKSWDYIIEDTNGKWVNLKGTDQIVAATYNSTEDRFYYTTTDAKGNVVKHAVDNNENVYYLTNADNTTTPYVFLRSDDSLYTGTVRGLTNEILMTAEKTENDNKVLYTYWGAKLSDDQTLVSKSDITVGDLNKAFRTFEANDKNLAQADITNIKLTQQSNGNGGTLGMVRNNNADVLGEVTISSTGGTNGQDVKVQFSNQGIKLDANGNYISDPTTTTTFTVDAGSKVVANNGGTGDKLSTISVNGKTYSIVDTDTRNTVSAGNNVNISTSTNADGTTNYQINATDTNTVTSLTAGTNVTVNEATDDKGNKTFTISATDTNNYVTGGNVSYTDGQGTLTLTQEGIDNAVTIEGLQNTYTTGATIVGNDVTFVRNDGQSYGVNFTAGGGTNGADTFVQIGGANGLTLNTGSKVVGTGKATPDGNAMALSGITINGKDFLVPVINANTNPPTDEDPYLTSIELNGTKYKIVSEGSSTDYSIVGEKNTTVEGSITYDSEYSVEENQIKLNLIDNLTQQVTEDAIIIDDVASASKLTEVAGKVETNTTNITENATAITNLTNTVNAGWNLKVNDGEAQNVELGDTVTLLDGDNMVVTSGANGITFATKKDVAFGTVSVTDTVTVGNIAIDKANGIGMSGMKITNLAAGVDDTDAVNVSQLNQKVTELTTNINNSKTVVEAGNNVTISSETDQTTGQVTYTINGKKTTVSTDDTNLTITAGTEVNGVTDYNVSLNESITLGNTAANQVMINGLTGTLKLGNTVVISTSGINMGGMSITNLSAGVNDTDAVNVSQLNDAVNTLTANDNHLVVNPNAEAGHYAVNKADDTVTLKVQGKDANGGTVYTDVVIDDVASATDLNTLENRVSTNETNISKIQGDITDIQGNITNVEGNITKIEDNINNINTAVTNNTNTINNHETRIDAIEGGYVKSVTKDNTSGVITVETNKGSNTFTDTYVQAGTYQVDANNQVTIGIVNPTDPNSNSVVITDIASKTELDALDSRVTTVEGDITNIKGDITNIKGDITSLDNRVTTNENNITNIQGDITDIQNNITNLDNRVTTNETNITNLDNRVTNVEGDITDIQNQIKNMEGNFTDVSNNYVSNITNNQDNTWTVNQTVTDNNGTHTESFDIVNTTNADLDNAWNGDDVTLTLTDSAGNQVNTTIENVAKASDLDKEIADRQAADAELNTKIEKETADRIAADEAEAKARQEADEKLEKAISDEADARKAADDALSDRIEKETADRIAADEAEAKARQEADEKLEKAISDEADARKAADDALSDRIDKETADREKADADEAKARQDADNALSDRINDEAAQRQAEDASLSNRINEEAAQRQAEDASLSNRINEEAAQRQAEDASLSNRINEEAAQRQAEDASLSNRISQEISDRIDNDIVAGAIDREAGTVTLTKGDQTTITLDGNLCDSRLDNVTYDADKGKLTFTVTDHYDQDKQTKLEVDDIASKTALEKEVTDRQTMDNAIINDYTQRTDALSGQVNSLGHRMTKAVAGAAALAALHPLDFDPDDKLSFSAGVGNYGGSTAAAIGAFYRPNERVMFNIGGTVGNGENMVNAGISFALGKGGNVTASRVAATHEINDLRQQVAYLSAVVAQMAAQTGYQFTDMKPFPDTPENHWAYEYVAKLAAEGIVEGYPNGNFDGDRTMTRYEFAAMLFHALEKGITLDTKIIDEFEPELGRLSVERIKGEQNQKEKIERVRLNNTAPDRDAYGGKINVGKNWP